MKNHKKILTVSLPVLLLFSMVSFLLPAKAEAYAATSAAQIQNATFEFKNRGLIVAKIGGESVDFIDSNPFDEDIEFLALDYDCDAKIDPPDDKFSIWNLGNYPGSLDPKHIDIDYNDGSGNGNADKGCSNANVAKAPTGVDVGMRTWFNWVDEATIESIDGELVFKKTGNNDYFLLTSESGESCQDRVFVNNVVTRAGDNTRTTSVGNTGKYFELSKDGSGGLSPSATAAKTLPLGDCRIVGYNFAAPGGVEFFNQQFAKSFTLGNVANKTKAAGTGQTSQGRASNTTSAGDSDTSDCVANGGTTLEWILCPIITSISKATEGINALIEGQLNFNVNENLNSDIKRVWSIVRVIATSVLVIIMLLMVISQAISGGWFDAYTVRKMLPRLVVAAIAMQLSWDISVWLITLANDAGQGIKHLIALPFGGPGELDLPSLLNRLSSTWAGITSVSLLAFLFAAPTLTVAFLPGIALVVFTLIISVIIALATLLFRNVLILSGVIFLPLALLAWILPGTQKYWTIWKENFVKLLLLFPLIIALIYTGRVFAWMAAGMGEPGFLDFAMVLVGFFAPYFIIPKAFSWGGSLLSSASRAIAENPIIRRTKEAGNKGIGEWDENWRGARSAYSPYDKKLGLKRATWRGKTLPLPMFTGRMIPRLTSGHWMPTARGRALTQKKYKDYKEARDAEQGAFVDRQYEVADKKGLRARFWRWNNDNGAWEDNGDNLDENGNPKDGVGAAKLAVMRAMLHGNERERKMAMQKFFDTSSAIEGQGMGISLDPGSWDDGTPDSKEIQAYVRDVLRPHIESEYGIDNLEVDVNGHPIARMHMLPEFESLQKNNPQYWGKLGRGDWLVPVTQTTYSDRLLDKYGVTDEAERKRLKGKRLKPEHRLAYAIDESYIDASNVTKSPQGLFQEIGRLDSKMLSAKFANLLASVAAGGQGSVSKLVEMSGGEGSSLMVDLDKALKPLGVKYQQYIDAASHNMPEAAPKFDVEGDQVYRYGEGPKHQQRRRGTEDDGGGYTGPDDNGDNGGDSGGGHGGGGRDRGGGGGTTSGTRSSTPGVLDVGQAREGASGGTETGASEPQQVVVNLDHEELGRVIGRHVGNAVGDVIAPLHDAIKDSTQQRPASPSSPPSNSEDEEPPRA